MSITGLVIIYVIIWWIVFFAILPIDVNRMKTVKIDDVHYSMLKDIGKKWRMSPEDLLAELIQETYSNKKNRR